MADMIYLTDIRTEDDPVEICARAHYEASGHSLRWPQRPWPDTPSEFRNECRRRMTVALAALCTAVCRYPEDSL